jgi:putative transposase
MLYIVNMGHRSYNFRIYPNTEQKELFARHFGHNRFVWNQFLRIKTDFYLQNKNANKRSLNYHDTSLMLTEMKSQEEYGWLNEVNSQSLQQTLRQLDNAYHVFYKGISKFPNFKKKGTKTSFTIPQHISIRNNKLHIPKFKTGIDINVHRELEGNVCFATINKTACGNYYCSITVEFKPKELPKTGSLIGVDLGIKDFAILSEGTKYSNPRYFVSTQKKLAFKQRKLSRIKNKEKRTYKIQKHRVAKLHERVSNQRKDFLHKVSYEIVKNHDLICMESLNVKGMIRNHKLAKHIADVGWGYFSNFIKYKSEWYGKTKVEIDRFFPSSQICSECGYRKTDLKLSDREWVCIECGCMHDRDVNAAKNIKNQGLQMSGSWTDSDSKQKRSEPLPKVVVRKRKTIGEVLTIEAAGR